MLTRGEEVELARQHKRDGMQGTLVVVRGHECKPSGAQVPRPGPLGVSQQGSFGPTCLRSSSPGCTLNVHPACNVWPPPPGSFKVTTSTLEFRALLMENGAERVELART